MTTAAFTTAADHSTDAAFRAWGSELNTQLAAVGLVQTADTGQINWTTVTRAGANADAGYEVWRMNDTQQSSAPFFLKLTYGTGGSTSGPRMRVEVGTGSNGSGTITNTTVIATMMSCTTPPGATTYPSYIACGEGYLNIMWKGNSTASWWLSFCRSTDSSGTPDALAWTIKWAGISGGVFGRNWVTATGWLTINNAYICLVPYSHVTSAVGSDFQAFLNWGMSPRVFPEFASCHVIKSEFSFPTTFTVALVGSTPRTYMTSGSAFSSNSMSNNQLGNYALAFLYE